MLDADQLQAFSLTCSKALKTRKRLDKLHDRHKERLDRGDSTRAGTVRYSAAADEEAERLASELRELKELASTLRLLKTV